MCIHVYTIIFMYRNQAIIIDPNPILQKNQNYFPDVSFWDRELVLYETWF